MLRCCQLALITVFLNSSLCAAEDTALWSEYGLVHQTVKVHGRQTITAYQMKDSTGALAAWQWLRPAKARPCDLSVFCTQDGTRTVVADANYVVTFEGLAPARDDLKAFLGSLPNRRDSSLPAILTFMPTSGRVPNSGRYVLGPVSLRTFAPGLDGTNPGFEQGAEAQVADYVLAKNTPARLVVFYYATPEMARLHAVGFKAAVGANVKRSGVLVAIASGPAAESLLSRIQYEAKITWNEAPPPSPIKPLYRLLKDILYISALLSLLSLSAGLVYAGMRLYRRRYGTLDDQEAMTTLHLTGE